MVRTLIVNVLLCNNGLGIALENSCTNVFGIQADFGKIPNLLNSIY
jgi:hypothetical protein